MLGSSLHHHRNMSFPHGGSVIHNNIPPTVSKKMGGGRLNAVVNKLHLAKQCSTDNTFPDMVSEESRLSILQNLLNPAPSSNSEKKNLRAPPALFPLTSEVTIQRYPVVHPIHDRPLDVFQRLKRLGTDIEMEEIGNETTLSLIPVSSSQSASVSCIPTNSFKTNSPATSLIVLPKTNVFNNRKIPEPSVVLEMKVTPKQKAQNIFFNGKTDLKSYVFSIDQSQISITNNGQKLYSCNVCSGIYQRRGALKKHYLKAHINYHFLTSRDLQIAGFKGERLEKMVDKWKNTKGHVGYYHCHKCCISYGTAIDLRHHVMNHPPALQSNALKKIPDIVTKVCELCLYCDKKIENEEDRKSHLSKMHPPKRRCHICTYCQLNFFDLYTLHKHMCTSHEDMYYGCAECKERFISRELAKNHKTICLNNLCIKLESDNNVKKEHLKEEPPKIEIIELKIDEPANVNIKNELSDEEPKTEELKKNEEPKTEDFKKNEEPKIEEFKKNEEPIKEDQKKKEESKSYPFYCPDCKKGFTQQPNLARHMSLGHGKKLEYKKSKKLLQPSNKLILSKKLVKTQEKELKDEIQDLSANGTQYVFLNNKNELVTKQGVPFDISYMNLEIQTRIRRMVPSLYPSSSPIEDDMSSLEVDAASSYGFPSSHDDERKKLEGFSGEWLYPRSYICSACPATCSNIWDIFYHKWNVHPNVLCHHYDIPLDQLPSQKWRPERNLSRVGLLSECEELPTGLPQCTKCGKMENDIAQLHRHLLDCGGDTEWLKTMVHTTKSPNSKKSRKNWRPFNFRRRKNGRARHGLKRTPPTPPLPVVKTKPGDAESVSRMIADLPPKRVTRRLVFETPNGNNQATINSSVCSKVPIDMSSRNPTVSSSSTTLFNKKVMKPLPVKTETAMLISEAPDFLRSLNIMRAPLKSAEHSLPSSKTETEEIIAAMKETLMASPAPIPVILPKKRKRPIYDFKQLAEKIAKHDHNEILDSKVEEDNDNIEESIPIPVVVKNKGKKLMNEIEVGLIKQNRLRRKREIPPVPEKLAPVPSKRAKIENSTKSIVESIPISKSKKQALSKKTTKVLEKKTIDDNFVSKIQTRNRKKNFIEESLSNEVLPSCKDDSLANNNESSSFVDFESSQEVSSSEVPPKQKTVKVNPFKPKARNRRKPGVFFGSRKRKRNLKTDNKKQQPTSSKVDDAPLLLPKLEYSDSTNLIVSNLIDKVLPQEIIKTDNTVQSAPQELKKPIENESLMANVKEENKATAPISADTTESKEPEEVAEPRWHSQSDAFFDLPSAISLGSILSSVNQILEGPDCNVASTEVNDYSWTELQRAMGATDEEMAILQNFGSNSSEEGQNVTSENCLDLLDMDGGEDTNINQEQTDTQNNSELNFKCKVCDQCYKGVAAFRIHSLDVHNIEDPELVNVIKSDYLLVCWVCKLIMEGGAEELDEHMAKDHEFDDAPNSENGKELKNKMVSKLGEILDQALKNLISSTQKPCAGKTWSGGAITLLGKLCALRNNEKGTTVSSSVANSALAKDLRKVIGRNNNGSSARAQSRRSNTAHALQLNARLAALSVAAKRLTPLVRADCSSNIYKCPICDIGFETTSTRNKHISRAHNSPQKSNHVETAVQLDSTLPSLQTTVLEETPEPSDNVQPMFALGTMNRRGLKKFNSTCSEEVRARAKQALRDLEIKSRLKHYTFSGDHQPSPN
ncbi:uncharacterized protein LOC111039252 isoform X2 [Myzus persicae]|uniref:uncharacterized protein LOC111039252 isoform X2 n=1 Tax=Myzus persicae TaxID=13164 RepID=UPI000B936EF3|nr:uncharacterized protein LOC111039252 isoform X2 [Myzus persicae]